MNSADKSAADERRDSPSWLLVLCLSLSLGNLACFGYLFFQASPNGHSCNLEPSWSHLDAHNTPIQVWNRCYTSCPVIDAVLQKIIHWILGFRMYFTWHDLQANIFNNEKILLTYEEKRTRWTTWRKWTARGAWCTRFAGSTRDKCSNGTRWITWSLWTTWGSWCTRCARTRWTTGGLLVYQVHQDKMEHPGLMVYQALQERMEHPGQMVKRARRGQQEPKE